MLEREQPDLDEVREAMRDHDERLREEHTGDEPAGDETAEEHDEAREEDDRGS